MSLSFTKPASVDATYEGQEGNHISLTSVTFFRIEEEKKKKKQTSKNIGQRFLGGMLYCYRASFGNFF